MDLDDLDLDPIVQLQRWLDDAVSEGLSHPNAMALATADAQGRPCVRHVLLKGLDRRGLEWYTNYESRKGHDLADNPFASVVFPWFAMWRQVVVSGRVAMVAAAESDAYFASRDRGSQIGAWASPQTQPIRDREWLENRVHEIEQQYEGRDVPRPPHWGGYRLTPEWFDFWHSRPDRLHDRFRYERTPNGWTLTRLAP